MVHFSAFSDGRQRGFNVFHGSDDDGASVGAVDLPNDRLLQLCGLSGIGLDLKGDEPAVVAANDVGNAVCAVGATVLFPTEAAVQRPQMRQNGSHDVRFTHIFTSSRAPSPHGINSAACRLTGSEKAIRQAKSPCFQGF
jgi:hypothetical protein